MKNFIVLLLCQKGGVGKTTIADELTDALIRKGQSVCYISTDAQGGSVHESKVDPDATFHIVDTAGVLTDEYKEWCRSADLILIPMKPSPKDLEPTMRTYDVAISSKTNARIGIIINEFNPREKLCKQLKEFLLEKNYPIFMEIPRSVLLSQASAQGISIAEHDKSNPTVPIFNNLANVVISEYNQIIIMDR